MSASFGVSTNMNESQNKSFPENLNPTRYDKFSVYVPQQSKKHVIVPDSIYELFKGIALLFINLCSKEQIKEKDLLFDHWLDCGSVFFPQFPDYLVNENGRFMKRSDFAATLRQALAERHEELMAQSKDSHSKIREEIERFSEKLKSGDLSLEKLSLRQNPVREEESKAEDKIVGREKRPLHTFADGDTYEGEWVGGKMDGEGVLTGLIGDRYSGSFREGNYHGRGEYVRTDNHTYSGELREGKRTGRGVRTWPDGKRHEGAFLEGKAHGLGIRRYPDGSVYYGEWQHGNRHGQGVYVYASGDVYVGEHRDGKWEGQGTFYYNDGSHYKGQYKDDKRHGEGVFTYAGMKERAVWEHGKEKQVLETWV